MGYLFCDDEIAKKKGCKFLSKEKNICINLIHITKVKSPPVFISNCSLRTEEGK